MGVARHRPTGLRARHIARHLRRCTAHALTQPPAKRARGARGVAKAARAHRRVLAADAPCLRQHAQARRQLPERVIEIQQRQHAALSRCCGGKLLPPHKRQQLAARVVGAGLRPARARPGRLLRPRARAPHGARDGAEPRRRRWRQGTRLSASGATASNRRQLQNTSGHRLVPMSQHKLPLGHRSHRTSRNPCQLREGLFGEPTMRLL